MNIKYQALQQCLRKKIDAIYVLIGQDYYLLNESQKTIKNAWHEDSDHITMHMASAPDWNTLFKEANCYSMFTQYTMLDAHFDKKSFDAASKECITTYLKNTNENCLIIIRAPLVPLKQLQWIAQHEKVTIVQATSFDTTQWQRFIADKLSALSIQFDPSIPALIHQYTQGNLGASMQLVEKIALVHVEEALLTPSLVLEQVSDQCEYQLYELADACLNARTGKAIHLLRQAEQQKTEPTLILWLLTQEIRQLMQLSHLVAQSVSLANACQQLKIWPQRVPLYAKMLSKLSLSCLRQLLCMAQQIDELIKSSQNKQVWQKLEQLAMTLSTGEQIHS